MPAPKGRGGTRGGGIAGEGRFDLLSQGSVEGQGEEDQVMAVYWGLYGSNDDSGNSRSLPRITSRFTCIHLPGMYVDAVGRMAVSTMQTLNRATKSPGL